ncbi:MAG: hypothetical protein ACLPKB_17785, partial [Xanthobacteraceae bacterium]
TRQLRAFVGIVYSEISIDHRRLLGFVDYKIAGQTPAFDVDLRMSAKVFDGTNPPAWEMPDTIEDVGKGGVILPAISWRRHCPVKGGEDTSGLIEHLTNREKRVWVWGTISYVDIFGKTCGVQFRFWSSSIKKNKTEGEYFSLIPEVEYTTASYGES